MALKTHFSASLTFGQEQHEHHCGESGEEPLGAAAVANAATTAHGHIALDR